MARRFKRRRFRRRFRRYPKRSFRRRYFRRNSRKIARLGRQVRRLNKAVEWKLQIVNAAGNLAATPSDTTNRWLWVPLIPAISIGSGINNRNGSEIILRRLKMNLSVTETVGDLSIEHFGIVRFFWFPNGYPSVVATDGAGLYDQPVVHSGSTVQHPFINPDIRNLTHHRIIKTVRFHIFPTSYDTTTGDTTNKPLSFHRRINLNLRRRVTEWNRIDTGGVGTNITRGALWMQITVHSAGNPLTFYTFPPAYTMQYKLNWQDV